jgi:glutathione S-transferase
MKCESASNANILPVPVLQYTYKGERRTMIESTAHVRYLANISDLLPKKHGSRPSVDPSKLIPSLQNGEDLAEIAEFEQWYAFAATTMDTVLWNFRIIDDFRKNPGERSLLEYYIERWNEIILPQLAARFEDGREFIMKSGFTIADIVLAHNLFWSRKYTFLKKLPPRVFAYEKRMRARPALQLTFADAATFETDRPVSKI